MKRFTIKLAEVCTIIETVLIFYISDIEADPSLEEEELCQKFHDEYMLSIFNNECADK